MPWMHVFKYQQYIIMENSNIIKSRNLSVTWFQQLPLPVIKSFDVSLYLTLYVLSILGKYKYSFPFYVILLHGCAQVVEIPTSVSHGIDLFCLE